MAAESVSAWRKALVNSGTRSDVSVLTRHFDSTAPRLTWAR